ncbi:MAG: hypothetical protein IT353_03355 [Gemmatimonadaceae bacterium]|nr:hypothetical protein [Gemmatimonadaceae bacterium]
MRRQFRVAVSLCITLAMTGCDWQRIFGCAGVGYHALRVDVRDATGAPQALGATVTIYDGAYEARSQSIYDTLAIYAASERGGREYDIQVSKPHYQDTWVRGVATRGGGCVTGHEVPPVTRVVPVVLSLVSSAPPVRSIHLLPPRILLDRGPTREVGTFTAHIDTDVGVSRDLRWRIAGDTASVVFDDRTGTVRYRCLSRSGYLTVTAISVVDSSVVGRAEVAVQGHPAAPNDPPCG